jgi:hypothetical protein
MRRCCLLLIVGIGTLTTGAVYAAAPAKPVTTVKSPAVASAPSSTVWHDVTQWGVEGREWTSMERQRWFDRFPSAAESKVTKAVWGLSRDSAGMMVRFETDATTIWVRYVLRSDRLAMPHMPATGVSGVDLYTRDPQGKWRWVNCSRPDSKEVCQAIAKDITPGLREYAAYLPLYNGVESLEFGVAPESKFKGLSPRNAKPIVFYGTSITHGACASRPGMVHTAILGRRFDCPVVNLGFSGNGRMDAAVGEFMAQIDAAVYVIDCLPNMNAQAVSEKCVPLVKQLRAARPGTPIILVEDRPMTNTWIRPERQQYHAANHAALREAFDTLNREGVARLYYLPGDGLLGDDAEASNDGSHPSDLGFVRQADAFEPVLRQALTP